MKIPNSKKLFKIDTMHFAQLKEEKKQAYKFIICDTNYIIN